MEEDGNLAKNQFEGLLDELPIGIAIYDLERRLAHANPYYIELLHIEDVTAEPSSTLEQHVGEAAEILLPAFAEVLDDEHPRRGILHNFIFPEGDEHLVSFSLVCTRDEAGNPKWVALIVIDESELRHAFAERDEILDREQNTLREAETAIRLREEFTAMLTHELRTPLTAILGWAELLRGQAGDPDFVVNAADYITQSVRSQMRMVEDMLDLSRIRTGRMKFNPGIVDVAELGSSIADQYRLSSKREIEVFATEGCYVEGDYERLSQVFTNLIENAVKYGHPPRPITVKVGVENDEVYVRVQDYGIGIEPDKLETIFDRFQQADSTSRRRYGGLGLGLAIVREIVTLHGGRVLAESKGLGFGSVFTVRIPASNSVPTKANGADLDPIADRDSLANLKVLLVHEEPAMQKLLFDAMQSSGALVEQYTSAVEALEAMKHGHFDALVSQIGMPVMDGIEMVARMRAGLLGEEYRMVSCIAITENPESTEWREALDAGFDGFVSKSLAAKNLVATIQKARQRRIL